MGTVLALLAAFILPGDAEEASPSPESVALPVAYVAQAEQSDASASDEPERWTGTVDAGGVEIRFIITIERDGEGETENWSGSIDIPMQGVEGLRLSQIVRTDEDLAFVAPLPGAAEVNWPKWSLTIGEGGTAQGVLRQAGGEFPTTMRLADEGENLEPQRPQEPKPPFPYRTEEVTVATEAGHTLAGTLSLPDEAAFEPPYPTAVLITGSGAQDRDETLLGHKPFAVLADHLARRGIASLRCDDRGFGASTGSFATATTLDFVDDAREQVEFLVGRDEVGSIGLIGHSEGGLVAPFVAADNDEVGWVVLLAGTGVPGREVLVAQTAAIQIAGGADEAGVLEQMEAQKKAIEAALADDFEAAENAMRRLITLQMKANGVAPTDDLVEGMVTQQSQLFSSQPWMRTFLTLDPRPALQRVTQPVLVLNGELDLQVLPDQNVPAIERALAGNPDVEVHVLSGLNHLFQPAETGSPAEYIDIETTFDPGALEIISGWIRRR